ncbi:MAG: hypothetical protein WC900_06430 [Oscillospiraceae bacterium]|jgi:hypothetical protein
MLEIKQTRNISNYEKILDKLGIRNQAASVVEAYDKNEITGFGIYRFENGKVIIEHAESGDDLYLFDGIIRSMLFIAMTSGIEEAVFNLSCNELLLRLGFVKDNEKCIYSISDFMNNCKNCGKC